MGTHPIFESDFDCLTESVIFTCYYQQQPRTFERERKYQPNRQTDSNNSRDSIRETNGRTLIDHAHDGLQSKQPENKEQSTKATLHGGRTSLWKEIEFY